jgi:hypothetical protein
MNLTIVPFGRLTVLGAKPESVIVISTVPWLTGVGLGESLGFGWGSWAGVGLGFGVTVWLSLVGALTSLLMKNIAPATTKITTIDAIIVLFIKIPFFLLFIPEVIISIAPSENSVNIK